MITIFKMDHRMKGGVAGSSGVRTEEAVDAMTSTLLRPKTEYSHQ